MLQVRKLAKAYAGQIVFQDVTWHVSEGDRVALTGPNGAGKTTLLRILAGYETPDAGQVVTARSTTVGYLPQDGLLHQGKTLRQEALSVFSPVLALAEEQRELEERMRRLDAASPEYRAVLKRYGECQEQWDRHQGFSLEARVERVLHGLGFSTEELSAPTETLSGGWQMRIALAKLLLSRPSLLLLDEPTNHLDLEARNWLEDFLVGYPHAVVLVSHDRYFLDRVVTSVTEIDRRRLVDYKGNYSQYLVLREKQLAELRARAARQQEEIERMERFIDRFRYKATKAAQVQSRLKMLEKTEVIEVPPERKRLKLRLPQPSRSGRVVIELKGVAKRYGGRRVLQEVDLLLERGDRIALVGPNGAGKSSLMRLLAGVEPPDGGERKEGYNVSLGYFSQDRALDLSEEKTILENLMEASPIDMVSKLRNVLGAFLFRGDEVDKKVKVLSGGEKSRLALAKMLLRPANVLLLDEPTNHLDLDSKEVLLEALKAYTGTVAFVSHDRYFIDELATKVAALGDGRVQLYWGNYEDFLHARGAVAPSHPSGAKKVTPPREEAPERREGKTGSSKNRLRRIRQELEALEQTIAQTETAVASLEGRMAVPGFYDDADAAAEIVASHENLRNVLEHLYQRWEEVAAKKKDP